MRTLTEEPIVLVDLAEAARARRRRRLKIAAACVLLLGGGGFLGSLAYPRDGRPQAEARKGDIVHSLVAVGRVESDQTIEIVPKITARIHDIHVREGDRVEAGQVLVTLENQSLLAQRSEAREACESARARLEEIVRGARSEDLDHAREVVQETELDIERTRAREEAARAEAEYARSQDSRFRQLHEEGVVSRRETDDAQRQAQSAEAALREAAAAIEAARSRLRQGQARLARLSKGATEEERRIVEHDLRKAEAVLARLEDDLSQSTLKSPIRGVVARRYKEPSELASPEMLKPILVLVDEGKRIVRVEVLETDIYKVRIGGPAILTSDSYPGRRWSGKVFEVAPTMGRKRITTENPKEKTDVKVLEVRIIPEEPVDLPLNLPVEARIVEVVRRDVLTLPVDAVDASGRVRLPNGTTASLRIGARDDGFVEVLSGVLKGDRVLMRD